MAKLSGEMIRATAKCLKAADRAVALRSRLVASYGTVEAAPWWRRHQLLWRLAVAHTLLNKARAEYMREINQ